MPRPALKRSIPRSAIRSISRAAALPVERRSRRPHPELRRDGDKGAPIDAEAEKARLEREEAIRRASGDGKMAIERERRRC